MKLSFLDWCRINWKFLLGVSVPIVLILIGKRINIKQAWQQAKEDKEKDDYGRNHYPEKGEYIKLGDEEREAMKGNKLGIKENEIGDADDNVGLGSIPSISFINYFSVKIYPYMD